MALRLPRFVDVPPPAAPLVVAGDVHLTPARPAVAAQFAAWLDGRRGRGGTLVLLGDVFEGFVSRRQTADPFVRGFLDRLAALAAEGTRVVFQGGNRDFAFDGADGLPLELWPDVVRTTLGARTALLTHGDLLCTADPRYQRMRRLLRSRPVAALRTALPYAAVTWVARGLRDLSEREVARKPYAAMGIDYAVATTWMEAAGADVLVAGHVHTGVHHRLPGDRPRDVLVLKDWDAGGGVVAWDGTTLALVPPATA